MYIHGYIDIHTYKHTYTHGYIDIHTGLHTTLQKKCFADYIRCIAPPRGKLGRDWLEPSNVATPDDYLFLPTSFLPPSLFIDDAPSQ